MPREAFWLAPQDRHRVYASLAALAGVLALGVAAIAFFLSFTWPAIDTSSSTSRMYVGDVDDFEVGVPVTFPEGKFHLVKREGGSFIALYWASPHKGCSVPWRENFRFNGEICWFRDPCYGSTWDQYGVRIFGPSPRNLDQFPVEVVGDKVYVLATEEKLILGEDPNPH